MAAIIWYTFPLLLPLVLLQWMDIRQVLVLPIIPSISLATMVVFSYPIFEDNATYHNVFLPLSPILIVVVATCSILLDSHLKYTRLYVRDSELARRLDSLNETYLTYVRTLHTNTSNYQMDISSDDFLNDRRLKGLLDPACYERFKIDILDLRETSERLADSSKNVNTSFSYRMFRWLKSVEGTIRTFKSTLSLRECSVS